MLITFVTILASLYVVVYMFGFFNMLFQYISLPPSQQAKAKISVNAWHNVGFLCSVAWIITLFVS